MSVNPDVLRWRDLITTVSAETSVPAALLAAVIDVESRGDPNAVNSTSGAAGLMQVISRYHEQLIRDVVLVGRWDSTGLARALLIPEVGLRVGARHLAWCIKDCGSEERGLAKYHTGACDAGNRVDSIGTKTTYYVEKVMDLRPRYAAALAGEAPKPSPALTIGRVPKPPVVPRHLTPDRKPSGWSRLGKRTIVGTVTHRMLGTLRGSEHHFLSNDPHGRDALTDYGIGGALDGDLDGVIWEWLAENDDRSPWASGPSDGLEGDGPAFVRAYGVASINRDLRSVELSGQADTPVTPKQFEALCQLLAYIHDRAGVPWNRFPINPKSGVVTQLWHSEFARKDCPFGVVKRRTTEYQDRVRAIMRQHQEALPPQPPTPPPVPVEPKVPYAASKDQAFLRRMFGTLVRYDTMGKVIGRYPFDPRGVISNAWIERADAEDEWPAAKEWLPVTEGRPKQLVTFANGWALQDFGDQRGWQWAGRDQG